MNQPCLIVSLVFFGLTPVPVVFAKRVAKREVLSSDTMVLKEGVPAQTRLADEAHRRSREEWLGAYKGGGLLCDCVSESDLPHNRTDDESIELPVGFFDSPSSGKVYEGTYTRDRKHGTYCHAHDENTEPLCNGETPPAWCKKKWCYIKEDCACGKNIVPYIEGGSQGAYREVHGEMNVKDASLSLVGLDKNPTKRVWFSYENCDPEGATASVEHMQAHLKDPDAYAKYQNEKNLCGGGLPRKVKADQHKVEVTHSTTVLKVLVGGAIFVALVPLAQHFVSIHRAQ